MVGLFLEERNTTWGQWFQFQWPDSFWFCSALCETMWKGHHHDNCRVNALNSFKVLFWKQKHQNEFGYVWLCANQMPLKFFCWPYPIQSTPISMPTTPKTEKQSLLPQCNFPRFHQRCGTQIGKPRPVRYVLRMTERSRGLENPSLMELTRGGSGTRWLMETKLG